MKNVYKRNTKIGNKMCYLSKHIHIMQRISYDICHPLYIARVQMAHVLWICELNHTSCLFFSKVKKILYKRQCKSNCKYAKKQYHTMCYDCYRNSTLSADCCYFGVLRDFGIFEILFLEHWNLNEPRSIQLKNLIPICKIHENLNNSCYCC